MASLPAIHICLISPAGYVHADALLDPAQYFAWQFRRLGADVSLARNVIRHDAVNFIFGAHLGFPVQHLQGYCSGASQERTRSARNTVPGSVKTLDRCRLRRRKSVRICQTGRRRTTDLIRKRRLASRRSKAAENSATPPGSTVHWIHQRPKTQAH